MSVENVKKELVGLLAAVIRAVVDEPSQVDVTISQGEQTTVYQVSCSRADLGKVIGKQGNMAKSLRMIVTAVSGKHGFRAVLDILE